MTTKEIIKGIFIYYNFINNEKYIIDDLGKQCIWDTFTINNKELSRIGSFEGECINKLSPWLRCPSIENQTIHKWSPIIKHIRDNIINKFKYNNDSINIAKIQKYDNGNITIYPHSDKIIDLDPLFPIFIIRFGSTRTALLINKETKEEIEVKMPHNSLLYISYEANLLWKHGIKKDETIYPSYSIVFRKSCTYLDNETGYVFGMNTPFKYIKELTYGNYYSQIGITNEFKSIKELKVNSEKYYSKEQQKKKLIQCFTKENNCKADISIYKDIIDNCIYP